MLYRLSAWKEALSWDVHPESLYLILKAAPSVCDVQPGPLQDAIKKTSKDELPDFYNIQLERPKDDDKGYDVLFIDAASKVSAEALPHHTCSVPCMANSLPVCGYSSDVLEHRLLA